MAVVRVVTVGNASVGKTSLLCSFQPDWTFQQDQKPTLGMSFLQVERHGTTYQFWDTVGSEQYAGVTRPYLKTADIVLMCFDVTSLETITALNKWHKEVTDVVDANMKYILVGTKADLRATHPESETVSDAMSQHWATTHDMKYIETSALNKSNITELFDMIEGFQITPAMKANPEERSPTGGDGSCC
jgi:small GTP-binding protein